MNNQPVIPETMAEHLIARAFYLDDRLLTARDSNYKASSKCQVSGHYPIKTSDYETVRILIHFVN